LRRRGLAKQRTNPAETLTSGSAVLQLELLGKPIGGGLEAATPVNQFTREEQNHG